MSILVYESFWQLQLPNWVEDDAASFASIDFTHQYVILLGARAPDERLSYIRKRARKWWRLPSADLRLRESVTGHPRRLPTQRTP